MERINILLIGKTGSGKSATGNTILERKVFRNLASTTLVTNEIQFNFSEYNDCVMKVVDTPGLMHRDLHESNEALHLSVENVINQAVAVCPDGYHAIIYVVKFNGHFTIEDVEIVKKLGEMFGENPLKEIFTIVMTHGDNFYNEDLGDFKDWCSIQENDAFEKLLKNSSKDIILIDNKTKDEKKTENQLKQLLQFVTPDNKKKFSAGSKAQSSTKQLNSESKEPISILSEKTLQESSLIVQQLMMIDLTIPASQLNRLAQLKTRATKLLKNIREEDKNTGALRDFIGNAINIYNSVEDQILTAQDAEEIYQEQGGLEKRDKTGKLVKEIGEIKLMELRLKEDARKVEEENIDLISDWTINRLQSA